MLKDPVRFGVDRPNPFGKWSQNATPGHTAEQLLIDGLIAHFAGESEASERLLDLARRVSDRAIEDPSELPGVSMEDLEESFNSLFVGGINLQDIAVGIRAGAYARGMLGVDVNPDSLVRAAEDLLDHSSGAEGPTWDDQFQAYHLGAVRMLLLAGRRERARDALARRYSFRRHAEEAELLRSLAALEGDLPATDEDLAGGIQTFLEPLKAADYVPDRYLEIELLRLEIAALADMYLGTGELDLQRAAATIVG